MANNNKEKDQSWMLMPDDRTMPSVMPRNWTPRDVYQAYAQDILNNNPQCWGKYNASTKQKNFWIYQTVFSGKNSRIVEVMNYRRWKAIMEAWFGAARKYVIYNGEDLSMGLVGIIRGKRIERDHSVPAVDWVATNKRPKVLSEEGKLVPDRMIYYTDDDYVRIGWAKQHRIPNEQMYEFVPTMGKAPRDPTDGFRSEFSKANTRDPSLKYKYKYYRLFQETEEEESGPGMQDIEQQQTEQL